MAENVQLAEWLLWSYQPKGLPGVLILALYYVSLPVKTLIAPWRAFILFVAILFNNGLCISSTVLTAYIILSSVPFPWGGLSIQSILPRLIVLQPRPEHNLYHSDHFLDSPKYRIIITLSFLHHLESSSSKLHNFYQSQWFYKIKFRTSKKGARDISHKL